MAKTVYSVILSDDVVAAVDALAAREGRSRSAEIDRLLAECLGVKTSEAVFREVLAAAKSAAGEGIVQSTLSPKGTLSMRSALRYKYNPYLLYTLEMSGETDTAGDLSVSLRSRNQALTDDIRSFFELWSELEQKYLPCPPPQSAPAAAQDRYRRRLRCPAADVEATTLGAALAGYVNLLDECIKTFFANAGDPEEAMSRTEATYRAKLPKSGLAEKL